MRFIPRRTHYHSLLSRLTQRSEGYLVSRTASDSIPKSPTQPLDRWVLGSMDFHTNTTSLIMVQSLRCTCLRSLDLPQCLDSPTPTLESTSTGVPFCRTPKGLHRPPFLVPSLGQKTFLYPRTNLQWKTCSGPKQRVRHTRALFGRLAPSGPTVWSHHRLPH